MFPQAKKIKGQLPLNEQGDQEMCLLSMTPTRLALLSPASGSRQCRASTDLGRGPHVSSSLHMHLPIPPLPSSFLSLSLPSFFYPSLSLSFLTIHLLHPFLLFLSSLKSVPSTYHQQMHPGEDRQKALSLRRQPSPWQNWTPSTLAWLRSYMRPSSHPFHTSSPL